MTTQEPNKNNNTLWGLLVVSLFALCVYLLITHYNQRILLTEAEEVQYDLSTHITELEKQVNLLEKNAPPSKLKPERLLTAKSNSQITKTETPTKPQTNSKTELESKTTKIIKKLAQQLSDSQALISPYGDDQISIVLTGADLFIQGDVNLSRNGTQLLSQFAAILRNSEMQIRVIGHSDAYPPSKAMKKIYPSNWELAAQRAIVVVKYLKHIHQLDPTLLEAASAAHYQPIADNKTAQGRAQNRRIEFILRPTI